MVPVSSTGMEPISWGITSSGYWNTIWKLEATAFSCREMYGRMPITAITVTSPPSSALLP
jgi:hypothetical protein